jgi:hypothetical protein
VRTTFWLAVIAALALAAGSGTSLASGPDVGAQPAAKKKAAKCKGKGKGKAKKKGKARRSLAADSAAKGKRKGKRKGKKGGRCKGKSKTRGGSAFGKGAYGDAAKAVTVEVTGGAKRAKVLFTLPSGPCFAGIALGDESPLTRKGKVSTATGRLSSPGFYTLDWTLTVKEPGLKYDLRLRLLLTAPDQPPCKDESRISGTLTKR